MKRIALLADLHCGHLVGLTPPDWQAQWLKSKSLSYTKRKKFSEIQHICWKLYADSLKKHGPFDAVVVNGDCIDGKGQRSGGTELITTNRQDQCEMAVECIRQAITRSGTKIVMTYGTAYHTGDLEDWENAIASELSAKIGSHEWIDVEGVIFDFKHKIGSSSVPQGRYTPLARTALWARLWADSKLTPKASVIVRSHAHYHRYLGDGRQLAMITPALQGFGTRYGSRECEGDVSWGFIVFECDKGIYQWKSVIYEPEPFRATALKI